VHQGHRPDAESLGEIDSRLGVGMTDAHYGNKVGDEKVLYDALSAEKLVAYCVSKVGVQPEDCSWRRSGSWLPMNGFVAPNYFFTA
jgi:hypothetical protein